MDIEAILANTDALLEQGKADEAIKLLGGAVSVAMENGDGYAVLQMLNELIGIYRELSDVNMVKQTAEDILAVAEHVCPPNTIPYATSLLNVATGYRSIGMLREAMDCYAKVQSIYGEILPPDHLLVAGLCNNMALLYQELQDFETAKLLLEKALAIVVSKNETYDEAVSRANLAGTCIQLGELEEAFAQARTAVSIFTELKVADQHFCAALSAMGSYYYLKGEYKAGAETFEKAMELMEQTLGKNGYYLRLEENYRACLAGVRASETETGARKAAAETEHNEKTSSTQAANAPFGKTEPGVRGLALCREYYEAYGKEMIRQRFPEYENRIAVGLAGEGSDCFGYDDAFSRDHDWGPEFCLWVTDETYAAIGEELQKAYEELPKEFRGFCRAETVQGAGRRGVMTISSYYKRFIGTDDPDKIDWRTVEDCRLAAAVNGEVFRDEEGIFTGIRNRLMEGYPEDVRYLKLAESCALFSQNGQYNLTRMQKRGDAVAAQILFGDALRQAMKIAYYAENVFPPHDKWLYTGLMDLEHGASLADLIRAAKANEESFEKIGAYLAMELYRMDTISDTDAYLDHQTEELLERALFSARSNEELAMEIAKEEFAAFDKVQNEGGRASCQNDWPTFSIMRRSQYLTWNRGMLLQYLYDFRREMRMGHNLITEKYGRMMASTAPERYREISENFPPVSAEKQTIVEQIAAIQVQWMEDFSKEYPLLAGNARSIHTGEDNPFNTSYETYLRGELLTYSDKMLELYARFVVGLAKEGANLAYRTMENSCRLYGYKSLAHAEDFLGK